MNEYNPFDKSLNAIEQADLQMLIDRIISEGWYIEYKSDLPKKGGGLDQDKIAKSVSAFANTKGGWLFYGMQCDSKNAPSALMGLDISIFNNLSDQLSQIIINNISPKPVFHLKDVLLDNGRHIIVIQVEECPTPPYITSQGVIYQRQNSESSPVKERYILERMAEKTDEYYQGIERFCVIDYNETKGQSQSGATFLEMYLFPLPYNDFFFKDFFASDFFLRVSEIFYNQIEFTYEKDSGEKESAILNISFNSIYSAHNSLVIRPLNTETIIYKTTTAELFRNGALKFTIPLNEFSLSNIPSDFEQSEVLNYLLELYCPYERVNDVDYMGNYTGTSTKQRKDSDFANHIKMIDGTYLLFVVFIVVTKYKAVLEQAGFDFSMDIGFRARLTETWRKFVFLDNEDYLDKIKQFNVPITPKNEIEIPRFVKGNYYRYKLNDPVAFVSMAREILRGIGLPDSAAINFGDLLHSGAIRFNGSR